MREGDLRGRRVLDCGCGTGALARRSRIRRPRRSGASIPRRKCCAWPPATCRPPVGLKAGRAEDLPFRDGWFERAVMWLACHLVDRPVAFRELRRVLAVNGRLVVVTFDPAHFGEFWLNRYFPSLEAIDRGRFPDGNGLARATDQCGLRRRPSHAAFATGGDHARPPDRAHRAAATSRRSTSSSEDELAMAPCRR